MVSEFIIGSSVSCSDGPCGRRRAGVSRPRTAG
jgi:hypothetical protein